MAIHVNESGSLKTVGTSSNIFIECFGWRAGGFLSKGMGVEQLEIPKDTVAEYQLPFRPSRVLLLSRVNYSGYGSVLFGLTQGEEIYGTTGVKMGQFGDGNYGPNSIRLLGNKLIFTPNGVGSTCFSGIIIAEE